MELALDQMEIAQREENVEVNDNTITGILNQLRKEPTNDDELGAKFQLYEDFFKTVEDQRKSTYDFWADCKEDFEGHSTHVCQQVETDLRKVDAEDNLGIVWNE